MEIIVLCYGNLMSCQLFRALSRLPKVKLFSTLSLLRSVGDAEGLYFLWVDVPHRILMGYRNREIKYHRECQERSTEINIHNWYYRESIAFGLSATTEFVDEETLFSIVFIFDIGKYTCNFSSRIN